MMDFFTAVWEVIEMAIDFLINLVQSLIMLLSVIVSASSLPTTLALQLPSFLATSVIIVAAITIIKLIIGRDNA